MKKDLFKNCKVQYAYDNKQKIYSVLVYLEGRPRIITFRVGDEFAEISLANRDGELLEVLTQKGNTITFMKKR
ncbi:MAG: hypothetical protein QXT45_00880 [Candidatus Bilamarchaeaceae archaeon]